ncbi:2-amino-4-hydroxy-6-hydroxymethyldihydropteridine diphosphokinase [Cellulomonas alba]|uniref:Bifunctional folate synthesis protein n=1 Tax=Cellulomonas alba TaxID=3053467 RepID=A0ABT7SIG7_9CELL|nr:2-amino-4-hydroxy-6-hydroxymethyldihydropteridine diphosphokinase [Cellulomonas alba]MDM7855359.1 2-amino-4-hydroxy-6-hydroxymethyldihydropteridine diphosphokinase [Cellulomonas alba]
MSTQDERSAAPLDRIRLTGVSATGYHGVFEHERREGQTFVADVVAYVDTRRAAARDDLAHTLDYGTLAQQVVAVLAGDPADLIETVAERIAATVLSHAVVQGVDVTVHKPQAPITVPFVDVTVEIHRDRNKLPAAEPVLGDGTTAERVPRAEPVRTAAMPVVGGPAVGAGAAPSAPVGSGTPHPLREPAQHAPDQQPPDQTAPDPHAPALPAPDQPAPDQTAPDQPAPGAPAAGADAQPVVSDAPVWAPIPGVSGAPTAPEPVERVVIAPAPVDALPTGVVPSVAPAGSETVAPVAPLPPVLPAAPVVAAPPAAPFVPPAPLVAAAVPVPPVAPTTPGRPAMPAPPAILVPPTIPVPPAPTTTPTTTRTATPTAEASSAANHAPVGELVPVDVVDGELIADALDEAPPVPVDVVIALGANLGPAQETLRRAVHDLAATPGLQIVQVSPLARTAPVGGPDQPDFLNAVVLARTTLAPRELLHAAQRIEQGHGRERHEHWGPRTLDVDLVVYGGVLAVTDDLELPHPRAHERAFVLQPWAEVDPHAVLPGLGGGPVAQLAATAPDREGLRWMALDWLEAPSPVPAAPAPAAPAPAGPAPQGPSAPASAGEHPPTRDV